MTKAAAVALSLLLALILFSSHDLANATSFTPAYTVNLSNSAVSANANITIQFELESPQANPSHYLSFIPSAFGVATGASVPDGAIVGALSVTSVESIANAPCSSSALHTYQMLDASVDTSAGNTLSDTPRIPSGSWPGFADSNANNLPDAVDKYPNFLKTLYPSLTPRARAYGSLPATEALINRVVNVLTFEPGTSLPGMSPMPASLGYVTVMVRQDPTAPAATSTITDTCTIFRVARQDQGLTQNNPNTAANESGIAYRTNPAADGTYTFIDYARANRDFDNDGIDNQLDSCPAVSTPSWNPRIVDSIFDPDNDGIPGQDNLGIPGEQLLAGSGCDPTPITANADADGDGYANRQDNCPLVANGTSQDNQADPDADQIGNLCDVVDTWGDGHLHEACASGTAVVGSGGTPTTPACPEFVLDQDGDGYTRAAEQHVLTDPADPCGNTGWPADLSSGGSSANKIDLLDLTSFISTPRKLNTSPGDTGYDKRWDVVPLAPSGKHINLVDLTSVSLVEPPFLEGVRAFNGPPCPYAP